MDPLTPPPLLLLLITVIGHCVGQDILPEGPVDAALGSDVVLKTLMNKPDYVFIIWNYNDGKEQIHVATVGSTGLKVNTPYEGRVSVNETNGYLSLRKLKPEDSGDYSITIVSMDGTTKTAEIKLRVLEPVSNVVIKSSVPEAMEHNSTVVLTCSARGSFLSFSWIIGEKPLVADGKRITIKNEDMSSMLTITGVLRSDLTDPVFCTAANKLEKEKSAPFKLTVHYGPDKVTISPMNVPQFIRAGSNFNLSCSAPSSPPATFTWFHNQQAMEAAGPVLTLKVIQGHGLGKKVEEYTCRATNTKTKRIIASAGVSFGVMEAISGTKITGPTSILIAGNSSANLSCQATAGAVTSTMWLKDSKALSVSSRLVFSDDKSSLMINPLQKEDSGEYKCQLTNPVNREEASFKMEVNFGPDSAMVKGEDAVEVNDPVTLTCLAMSFPPANFTWKFNGTVTDVKTAQYTIEKALYKHTGTYTCEAYNSVTGKSSMYSHKVSVKEEGSLDEGLSDGAIAGIIIAVLVALGAAIALTMYCRQKVPVESPY